MAKHPGGRPSRLNTRIATAIINALRAGNYIKTACEYAGIGNSTYQEWMNRGMVELDRVNALGHEAEEIVVQAETVENTMPDGQVQYTSRSLEQLFNFVPEPFNEVEWPYVVLHQQVTRARAQAEVRAMATIQQAAPENWQAAAWFLERTAPEKFGRRERINLEGSTDGAPIEIVSVDALEEKLSKFIKKD